MSWLPSRRSIKTAMAVVILAATGVAASGAAPAIGGNTGGLPAGRPQARSHGKPAAAFRCPGFPGNGYKLNPTLQPPPTPPRNATHTENPQAICAYVVGFSNVKKINESGLIGPGLADIYAGFKLYLVPTPSRCINHKPHPNCRRFENYALALNAGALEYHGLHEFPPATVTLLAFGFMPVTATLQLSQLGTLNAYALGPYGQTSCPPKNIPCQTTVTTLYSRVSLHISNVKINGVPFNVGPGCQSVKPFIIKLTGRTPYYNIGTGGELAGTVTIPPFKGCGAGENLNSIFTASVSGPGNEVLLTQGDPCYTGNQSGCPPCTPPPQRTVGKIPPLCTPDATQPAGWKNGN